MDYINWLPKEIVLLIHAELSAQDSIYLRNTCKSQRGFLEDISKLIEPIKHNYLHKKLLSHENKWITLHSNEVDTKIKVLVLVGYWGINLRINEFTIKKSDHKVNNPKEIEFILPEEFHTESARVCLFISIDSYVCWCTAVINGTIMTFSRGDGWPTDSNIQVDPFTIWTEPTYLYLFDE